MAINQAKLIGRTRKLRKPERVLPGIKRPLSTTVYYRRKLLELLKFINQHTEEVLMPILQQHQTQYIADSWVDDIKTALSRLAARFNSITQFSNSLSNSVVNQVNQINSNQFKSQFKNNLGLDIFSSEEGLQPFLQAKVQENIELIKSIPEDFLSRISTTVYQGVTQGLSSKEISKNIASAYDVSQRRAKFIARDQVAKINAAITQKRQEDLGIDEYIWRNADETSYGYFVFIAILLYKSLNFCLGSRPNANAVISKVICTLLDAVVIRLAGGL
jgi:uncharacterized protein with gpF-like domain